MLVKAEDRYLLFKHNLFCEFFRKVFGEFVKQDVWIFTGYAESCFERVEKDISHDILGGLQSTLFLILPGYSVEMPYRSLMPINLDAKRAFLVRDFFSDSFTDVMGSYRHWPFISYLLSQLSDQTEIAESPCLKLERIVIVSPDFSPGYFCQDYASLMKKNTVFLSDPNRRFFSIFQDKLESRSKITNVSESLRERIGRCTEDYGKSGIFLPFFFVFNREKNWVEFETFDKVTFSNDACAVAGCLSDALRRAF